MLQARQLPSLWAAYDLSHFNTVPRRTEIPVVQVIHFHALDISLSCVRGGGWGWGGMQVSGRLANINKNLESQGEIVDSWYKINLIEWAQNLKAFSCFIIRIVQCNVSCSVK